jgi:hypothetical protein
MVRAGFTAGAGTALLYSAEAGESLYESVVFRTEECRTVITAAS